jgi:high-affinity iron transporter
VWAGVGAAVVASLSVGAILTFTSRSMSFKAQEGFGGIMSIVAVAFVTGMIFWMRRQSRHLKDELQGKLDVALGAGAAALALTAFLAVGREGLETAMFLWPALKAGGSGAGVGAVGGLLTAVVLGYLVYRRSVHLNLAVFFRVTGAALVIVAAGVLAYGIHDLQEATLLPGIHSLAFDLRSHIHPDSVLGTLLKGIFNLSPDYTWAQAVAYVGYAVPTLVLFFRPQGRSPSPRPVEPAAPAPVLASR